MAAKKQPPTTVELEQRIDRAIEERIKPAIEEKRVRTVFEVLSWVCEYNRDSLSQVDDVREAAREFGIPFLGLWVALERDVSTEDIDELAAAPMVDRIVRELIDESEAA